VTSATLKSVTDVSVPPDVLCVVGAAPIPSHTHLASTAPVPSMSRFAHLLPKQQAQFASFSLILTPFSQWAFSVSSYTW
ncbi:MAG: hypothetical protein Q9173_004294, partial [Seirophora scorigena]